MRSRFFTRLAQLEIKGSLKAGSLVKVVIMQISVPRSIVVKIAAALACGIAGWSPAAAEQTAVTRILVITRNGSEIGRELISVERTPERTVAKVSVHMQVKLLGLAAFRFDHESTETWRGGEFEELTSQTTTSEAHHSLQVSRQAASLQVQADQVSRSINAAGLPASLWYEPHFREATLIDTADGHLLHIVAQEMGTEKIPVGGALIEARHYRLSGDLKDDYWFDADGVLLQRRSAGGKNSGVQFTTPSSP
jgi:hypothetical protein